MPNDFWQTPRYLFDELNNEFNFTVDACANAENKLCEKYYKDCLIESWENERVFLNPPYSNPRPFIEKAYKESEKCLVVALIKCDPSTRLWGIIYNYDLQEFRERIKVRFFPKRIKFTSKECINKNHPNFSSCLIVMRPHQFNTHCLVIMNHQTQG